MVEMCDSVTDSIRASQGSCRTGTGRNYIPYLLLHIYDWRKLLGRSECWFQEDSWRLRVRMIIFICSRCQVSSTIVRNRDSDACGQQQENLSIQLQHNVKQIRRVPLFFFAPSWRFIASPSPLFPQPLITSDIRISRNRTFTFQNLFDSFDIIVTVQISKHRNLVSCTFFFLVYVTLD